MRKAVLLCILSFIYVYGCADGQKRDSQKPSSDVETVRLSAMSSATMETFLLYARDIVKRTVPLPIDSPIKRSTTTYPMWDPESDTFFIPQSGLVGNVFWFCGGIPEPPEQVRLFLLNYLCLLEMGVQMRRLKKVYDPMDVVEEEMTAQWFALGFLKDLSGLEPGVAREIDDAVRFLRNSVWKRGDGWSDLESLKKQIGRRHGRLGALRLVLAAHMLPMWRKATTVDKWLREKVLEPAKRMKDFLRWWRPDTPVWTLREGVRTKEHGGVKGIVVTRTGYVILCHSLGLTSLDRRRRRVAEARKGLFGLRGICSVDNKIFGVERRFVRVITPGSLKVKNIKVWPHFRNISGGENFGIVPIAADTTRLFLVDNMQNVLLVFAQEGTLLKRIDLPHQVGGIALVDGNIYVTFPRMHTVERYDDQMGAFVTVAGVRWKFGHRDGRRFGALFNLPVGIAAGPDGALYVADALNHAVRRVTKNGDVTTVAGYECGEKDGKAVDAMFIMPVSVSVDGEGRVFVADGATGRVAVVGRRFEPKELPPRQEGGPEGISFVLRNVPLGERVYSALIKRAKWHLAAGRKGHALADLKMAQSLAPEWAETYFQEARLEMAQGRRDAALAALAKAVAEKQGLPLSERSGDTAYLHLLLMRATLLRDGNKKEEALTTLIEFFRLRKHRIKALSLPDLPEEKVINAYRLKAQVLAEMGRTKEAVEAFGEFIKAKGADAKTLLIFGQLLEQVKMFKKAAQIYERAVLLDETSPEPHYSLGRLYEDKLNDMVKALYCYKAYIRLKGKRKEEAVQRINQLKRLMRDRILPPYSESRLTDQYGRVWIVRRFSDGRVMVIPVEER